LIYTSIKVCFIDGDPYTCGVGTGIVLRE